KLHIFNHTYANLCYSNLYAQLHLLLSFPTRRSSDLEVLLQPWQEILEIEPRGPSDPGHQAFLHEPGGVEGREKGPQHDVGELMADRKSTRLNSSHQIISYAVFCLKKKTKYNEYNNNK